MMLEAVSSACWLGGKYSLRTAHCTSRTTVYHSPGRWGNKRGAPNAFGVPGKV
jgi:hypothetical protein